MAKPKAEKSVVCSRDGKWFVKTPKLGMMDIMRSRLINEGYVLHKEVTIPTLRTLEKWSMDGVAKTLLGQRIEPDGHSADGCPSWLIYLGFI
jgi:hypothetical protein